MSVGYTKPLFVLACDHRTSFAKLMDATWPMAPAVREHALRLKELVFDALVRAVRSGPGVDGAAFLVDEELGGALADRAHAEGILLAMPIEASGSAEFALEYGAAWTEHVERFRPGLVKVLVRRHPRADAEVRRREDARLRDISDWLEEHGHRFMFELVVPPLPSDLAGSTRQRFDAEVRPSLVMEVMAGLQDAGVEPDVWKIEGLERAEDCREVAAVARRGGRDDVRCIVLGRGADLARVDHWLRAAREVDGFSGFAIGRSLWWDDLVRLRAGSATEEQAVEAIAARYLDAHAVFTGQQA